MTDLLIESTVLEDRLRSVLPDDVDHASARLVDERTEHLSVRRNELEPVFNEFDTGVMISIWNGGGLGYAATTDLSRPAWPRQSTVPVRGPPSPPAPWSPPPRRRATRPAPTSHRSRSPGTRSRCTIGSNCCISSRDCSASTTASSTGVRRWCVARSTNS